MFVVAVSVFTLVLMGAVGVSAGSKSFGSDKAVSSVIALVTLTSRDPSEVPGDTSTVTVICVGLSTDVPVTDTPAPKDALGGRYVTQKCVTHGCDNPRHQRLCDRREIRSRLLAALEAPATRARSTRRVRAA